MIFDFWHIGATQLIEHLADGEFVYFSHSKILCAIRGRLPVTLQGRLLYQSCSVRKVSQLGTLPDFKPVMNQRVRCAEEPWVKASGTT